MRATWRDASFRAGCVYVGVAVALLLLQGAYHYAASDARRVLVFSVLQTLFVVLLYVWYSVSMRKGTARVERFFLAALVFAGSSYLFFFPPGSVPDEIYHFNMSYALSNYIGFVDSPTSMLAVRGDDVAFFSNALLLGTDVSSIRHDALIENFSLFASDPSYATVPLQSSYDFGANPPQVKIASALGILIAKALGLGSVPLFFMGRVFNFAFFAVLVYFAVRMIPVGKRIMMVVALLPMTLHVAGSYSYDAGIIGLSFLLTALCLKAIYGSGQINVGLCAGIVGVALLLAPCKVLYALIAFLVILVPSERFSTKRNAVLFKLIVLGGAALAVMVFRFASLAQLSGIDPSGSTLAGCDYRGSESGHFYTLASMLGDPLNTVLIFLRTLDDLGGFYLNTLVGGSLGWFQANLGAPLYATIPFGMAVLLSSFRSPEDKRVLPSSHRLLFSAVFCVGVLAVMTSMLLGWTFDTEIVIQGVQGRYFLPLLPLLLLGIRSKGFWTGPGMTFWFVFSMACLNGAYLVRLMAVSVS